MNARFALAAACALAAAAAYFVPQSSSTGTAAAQDTSVVAIRVRFGVGDKQPAAWDGEVTADSGTVTRVAAWHPRPGDAVLGTSWKLSSRTGPNFVRRPVEEDQIFGAQPYLLQTGIIVDVKPAGNTTLRFRTAQGSFIVALGALPSVALNGRVAIDRVAAAAAVSSASEHADFPTVLTGRNGEVWIAWTAFRDGAMDVKVRRFNGSAWEPEQSVANRVDAHQVQLGRDGRGRVWAVWSEGRNGSFDLFARVLDNNRWRASQRLTEAAGSDILHRMATDAKGRLWLVWQGERSGSFDVLARHLEGDTWGPETAVANSAANDWAPAIATDTAGKVYVAWDTYEKGNYDVRLRSFDGDAWGETIAVAETPRYEAHVTLACDGANRLWAAWNESGFEWGKDTGFLLSRQATALYRSRWMAMAVRENGEWKEPVRNIEESLPADLKNFNDLPQVRLDPRGRAWVFFRHRTNKFADTPDTSINHRAAWEIWGVPYEGSAWGTPVFLPFSQGRTDARWAMAADDKSNWWAAWPTDNRDFQEFLLKRSEVFAGTVPYPTSAPAAPVLTARQNVPLKATVLHEDEPRDLRRIRSYEIESGGAKYRIYRGDTHRHTEFSFDGNNDGTLMDAYRYSLDAAAMDFIGVSEHNNLSGPDHEYVNYLGQQAADLFHIPSKFVPLFAYERSVSYPNGHRNIIFAERGHPTLPIPPEEAKGMTGAKMLYEYLRKRNGIAISHTSASNMGTDWRDNDPEVEPLVEIYQGDRVSAEHEGAPKAAYSGNPAAQPGGYRPAGFVWNAWAKGYKLGVQSSSDHLSTHISYACTIASDFTRQGLLDAMRRRHSYGATDNIVLDYRLIADGREYLQGDIAPAANGRVRLKVRVLGTRPVRQIDVIRSNKYIHTAQPMTRDVSFEFEDAQPPAGDKYYYVRIIQVDEQMAWSSPVWIGK